MYAELKNHFNRASNLKVPAHIDDIDKQSWYYDSLCLQ